jgi:hypothetical protein
MKLVEITKNTAIILLQYTSAEKMISVLNQVRYKFSNKNKYDYSVNLTSSSEIKQLLHHYGLNILIEVKHIPISPFLSLFSYNKKYRLLEISYKTKFFSYFGSESILYLSKSQQAQNQ